MPFELVNQSINQSINQKTPKQQILF